MADTNKILQKLGGASGGSKDADVPANVENIDEPHPVANPKLELSKQPEKDLTHQPKMSNTLKEILSNTHQPSPDLPD